MAGLSSCANILPPQGGPRDSLPPRLVMATPRDSSVNVNTKNIQLVFDEYITLQSAFTNLVISPLPDPNNAPQVDAKLRTITIRMKEYEPNTTYSFNFGNAIMDVNESNIAKNFIYAFSTGSKMDYNTYSGKVIVAETGKPPADSSSVTVILHRNLDDSAVAKSNPRYYATLNGKGEFIFNNLPDGQFAVYVISNRFTKKYTDSTDMFAFRNTPITVGPNTPRDTLYAFEEAKRRTGGTSNAFAARPNTPINPTTKNEDRRLRYTPETEQGYQDILSPLSLNFNRKIFSFDSTKIGLYDTSYQLIKGATVSLDSARTRVSLRYNWKENTYYRVLIAKDALADSMNVGLTKADTLRFATKKETEYGSVRIRFVNLDLSRNPVLQLVSGDKIVDSVQLTSPDFQRKLFRPGNYDIRILFDENKNGKWDPGKFPKNKRQPEIVFLVVKPLSVRANWDNDMTVIL